MKKEGQPFSGRSFFTKNGGLLAAVCLLCSHLCAHAQGPVISGISPDGTFQFQPSNTLTFTINSDGDIDPAAITVQLTGVTLPGQTFNITLTSTNGLVITGPATSRSVSAPLTSKMVYTVLIQASDENEATASATVSFDTITPAYTFEAEDFDYTSNGVSGLFFDNPQTNAYAGLNAANEIDAFNASGGGNAYRPNPSGLATEINGDVPRIPYLGTGQQDYDVGWNDNSGNWGNYTRTFPAGTYNIYMRGANNNGPTVDNASMALVTGGLGTSNQTIANIGIFSVPNTGDYQNYTWVPLLDANGLLAKFTGGSVETLRVTTDNGNYNANFYLLMPADTSSVAISNISPDGSSFFQYADTFSFTASSASGIPTNNISVTLDGTNVTGLALTGSFTSWNVSCPVAVHTNHTAIINVTAGDGRTASATVSFNDFESANYQWEAEDYDYASNGVGGLFFDNPQTNGYAGLPSLPGVDNFQPDTNATPFDYRTNSLGACPSTAPAGDGQRSQFTAGAVDYEIGYFGNGSWVNYTRHYPAGTYYVWGRFAEGSSATEAALSQLTGGYGTASQTIDAIGTFMVPASGGWQNWKWAPLQDDEGNLVKIRFDGSQETLQLGGSPVIGQPEMNVNFVMLVPATPDPFFVVQALNVGPTNIEVVFSKPIATASATTVANYAFTNGLAVLGASLAADEVTVTLTTAPLVYGSNYSLVINGIQDRMNLPNVIATNTTLAISAIPYLQQDIGDPSAVSSITAAGNGVNVTATGSDFGGVSDQGNFAYQLQTGNFDVSVRVADLDLSDIFAKAGLMARETLDAGSRFAAAMTTPAMNGDFFEWRNPVNSASSSSGSFPANYPNTWLRLRRTGNTFTAYAGYDGQTWTQLGSASIAMASQVFLGFTVSSDSATQATSAQFRDFSTVTNGVVGAVVNPHDALGPSSRRTPIVFSEIMYKPAPRTDGKNLEFIELYNSNPWFQDISGYQVTCADMNYTFPPNTTLPGGGFIVIAAAPNDVESVYGVTNVMGPYSGSLKKSETLELLDERTNVLLTVPYSNVHPWPVAADGAGHSLVLANPTYGEGDPRAWDISDVVGGSPGQMEAFRPSPLRNVVINEILAHSENPAVQQFVELYNHSTNSVDISGCVLTDDPTTNEFVAPLGTMIGPAGFISFTAAQLGFSLNGAGETLYFINPDGSRILDAVEFAGQANGVAYGRWPDGANDFYSFTTNTPGTNNSAILIGNIAINELMYNPVSGNDDDQFIELYNQGTNAVNLSGWQFTSGVTFTFPAVSIPANGYLVVARNLTNLFAKYPNLSSANTVGNYTGKLSHNGELLALAQPETVNGTNTILVEEDEVTFGTGGRWGEWSSGGGSSLELIDPRANHRLAANWADSDETQKSVWTNIETTGVLDNGQNFDPAIDYAQVGILDVGECLVDNIEVDYNGSNYVSNPGFESGTNGWSFQGCMTRSSLENTGYSGSGFSLHMRCSDHMWTGDNSCQVALNNTSLQAGQTATLRFQARWLHGWPEAILRVNGNWLDVVGAMPIPANLGSPGMANSRAVADAGPAIYNVTHTPSLPAAFQPVVVTANFHTPNGLQSVTLYYRLDPSTNYVAIPMTDDGTGGDAVPEDGIFSATIPGQAANQIAAFYILATDGLNVTTRFPALRPQDNEPVRECAVMFGDGNSGGSFGVYHLWVTQTNSQRWAALGDLSNEGNDCTMVCGNRVIYNAQARFAGSPYHQEFDTPSGVLCHYKWIFQDDDQLLGATSFNKIHQPGNEAGDDPSLQREQLANTFLRALGVPWLNRRYVAVYVNGNRRGYLMEDTQCPDADMVKEHFSNDSDGYLYKMQPWSEFAPFLSGESMNFSEMSWCTLNDYTTTGGARKAAAYRYTYQVRRTPDSDANYTNVFSLVDAANSYGTSNYVASMENIADVDNWMRVFAANHAAGNWDTFGGQTGQNLYGYIGTQGTRYSLMMFDFNIVIGNQNFSWPPGEYLLTVNDQDPSLQNVFANPVFLRMYWRALEELVNGPLNAANSTPLVEDKYNVFTENGFNVEDPAVNIEPWVAQAQSAIAAKLAAVDAQNFTVGPVLTSNDVAYVSGTAPVNAQTISINGADYPVTWTTLTNWTATVPLVTGLNLLNIAGLDTHGNPIPGETGSVSVPYNGTVPPAAGTIVINEIMYAPSVAGAGFVELYNTSTNVTFDMSGWQIPALSYQFPAGSVIGPAQFLVLAANRAAFAAAYGATNSVFDTFSGVLQPGQPLLLAQPTGVGTNTLTVAEAQFDSVLPWPAGANGTGDSLQLVDSRRDNWRVGNWLAASPSPGAANTVSASLPPFQPLWINELVASNLTGITNSAGQQAPWLELYNPSATNVSLNGLYLANNYTTLTQWAFPTNASIAAGQFLVVFADGLTNLMTSNELHANFVLGGSSGSVALSRLFNSQPQVLDYVNYTNVTPDESYGSFPDGQSFERQEFIFPTPDNPNNGNVAHPPSFIAYNRPGAVYSQNFDALPNPGATSVNANNPVVINGVTYALAKPIDFAFPQFFSGNGGLGISALSGWYGYANVTTQFGATDGDQTTGGDISFGLPSSSNRALGLLATSSTGGTAFGAKFINATGTNLGYLDINLTGEVWRQSDTAKTLQFYYFVDPTATNAWPTGTTAFLPALNVAFPTIKADKGGVAVNGTAAANQTNCSVFNQAITNWPPGAALWLVWQMTDNTGKAQGLGIDNLSFSATPQPVTAQAPIAIQVSGGSVTLGWPTVPGAIYRIQYKNNLTDPAWTTLGSNHTGTGSPLLLNVDTPTNARRFYRVMVVN